MGRILAIDYGQKRTGVAVTDPLQITAGGLETVPTHQLMTFLTKYMESEIVDVLVVGQPKQMNCEASENAARINGFVTQLRKQFPDKQIVMFDERFTSVLAHRAMIDGGLKKKARQDKALVDKIAATIILQDYMSSRAMMI